MGTQVSLINSKVFLERLFAHLPNSLQSISLFFFDIEAFSEDTRGLWTVIDTTPTSEKFPKLNDFELGPDIQFHSLVRMHNQGIFEEFLPNLYKQGIMWYSCDWEPIVYPITPSTHTLSADDLVAWQRLSRISPFLAWADYYPESEEAY